MENIIKTINQFKKRSISFEGIQEAISTIDFSKLDYAKYLPEASRAETYSRTIICLEPIELVLLVWPPKIESAVHLHKNFYGFVAVLEGKLDNIEYEETDGKLMETSAIRGIKGGIIPEKDGIIHKLVNPSTKKQAVTLHIYYPALETLDGLKIYDLKKGKTGILNEKAKSASWNESEDSFYEITEHAFEFIPYHKHRNNSHRIFPIVPKPSSKEIAKSISKYYCEQAYDYDFFDLKHKSRKAYNKKINELIAEGVQHSDIKKSLTIACGTGRRAKKIKELSKKEYEIYGIDLSKEMVSIANKRGIKALKSDWLSANLKKEKFDMATFLYAFGHIPTKEKRIQSLRKINQHLNFGGIFFVDVFNVNDQNEWGPLAVKSFEKNKLSDFGYERGDVFYKKVKGNELAFLHYFEESELIKDLSSSGFKVLYCKHIGYVQKPGKILENKNEGSLFIKAKKIKEIC